MSFKCHVVKCKFRVFHWRLYFKKQFRVFYNQGHSWDFRTQNVQNKGCIQKEMKGVYFLYSVQKGIKGVLCSEQ